MKIKKQININAVNDFLDSFGAPLIQFEIEPSAKRYIPHLHATDIKTWLSCRRLFGYSKLDRIKTPGEEAEYFVFGKSGHKILATHYNKEDVAQEIQNVDTSVYSSHRQHHAALYDGYKNNYVDDFDRWQIASVENEIHLKFAGFVIIFTLDLLVLEDASPFPIYVIVDHKYYSRFPDAELLSNDFQASFYLWACRRLNLNVRKYVLNCIKKEPPSMPKLLVDGKRFSKAKKELDDTEYDLYLKAINEMGFNPNDYATELDYLKRRGSNTYKRFPTRRTDKELDNFEKDLLAVLEEMHDVNTRIFPHPQLSCPKCPYAFLCKTESSGGDVSFTKKSMFELKREDER